MQLLYLLIEIVVKCVVVFAGLMIVVAYLTWLERKVLGHIQIRYGPNRCGPFGLLQPFSDAIKAFFKEDLVPARSDKVDLRPRSDDLDDRSHQHLCCHPLWKSVYHSRNKLGGQIAVGRCGYRTPLYLWRGLPWRIWNYLGGWSSGNKYGLTGSLRAAAQMISYEVALGIAIVGVLILSQSLRLTEIVHLQAGGFWNWNIWYQPVAFVLYLICGLAEINRTPFDMPEAEAELACGFNIEYSSMKFALFFMAEYAHMVTMGAVAVTLFLGGWQPIIPQLSFIPGVVWFCGKLFIFLFFFIWERGTYPRLRYDQIMKFGWKILIPLALINLMITGLIVSLKG